MSNTNNMNSDVGVDFNPNFTYARTNQIADASSNNDNPLYGRIWIENVMCVNENK